MAIPSLVHCEFFVHSSLFVSFSFEYRFDLRWNHSTGFLLTKMNETSIRDVFLSMQFPPVDELVATSKTGLNISNGSLMLWSRWTTIEWCFVRLDFRTIRKSRRSCFRSCMFWTVLSLIYINKTNHVYTLDHVAKTNETIDHSNEIIDQLIEDVQKQNQQLKEHIDEEKKAIDDLLSKK